MALLVCLKMSFAFRRLKKKCNTANVILQLEAPLQSMSSVPQVRVCLGRQGTHLHKLPARLPYQVGDGGGGGGGGGGEGEGEGR